MQMMKVALVAALAFSATGCATKEFVNQRLSVIESRQDDQESRLADQEQRLNELSDTARQALERATDAGVLAQGKFLYSVVLSDGVNFETGRSSLPDSALSRLTSLAEQLKSDDRNVYIEIQGHTDDTGEEAFNQRLGQSRADSVRQFLHTQGVPLDRMATISYGESAPIESNDSASGRASNRRVEIIVLD